jgi:5-(carboxyamino)imidazole ribonucleotide synthase
MLALAAARLGFDVAVLEPEADSPAARVAAHSIVAAYDDAQALRALADLAQVVTYEFENVPAKAVARLMEMGVDVAPGLAALTVAQDRVEEKAFLNAHGAPTVAFAAADTPEACVTAAQGLGAPVLMKTRREGYDGKGQRWVEHAADAGRAFAELGGVPVILEAQAMFARELSVIAPSRPRRGDGHLSAGGEPS